MERNRNNITVFAACTNSDGSPTIQKATVNCSQQQYDLGEHYDFANDFLGEQRYDGPFVNFDENELEPLLVAAKQINLSVTDNYIGSQTISNNDVLKSLKVLNDLFAQANTIIQAFPDHLKSALIDYHYNDANLIHVASAGVSSTQELIGEIESLGVVFSTREVSFKKISKENLPYIAESFRPPYYDDNDVIYIPKDAKSNSDAFSVNNLIDMMQDHANNHDYHDDLGYANPEEAAVKLFDLLDGRHPNLIILEKNIEFFFDKSQDQNESHDDLDGPSMS